MKKDIIKDKKETIEFMSCGDNSINFIDDIKSLRDTVFKEFETDKMCSYYSEEYNWDSDTDSKIKVR